MCLQFGHQEPKAMREMKTLVGLFLLLHVFCVASVEPMEHQPISCDEKGNDSAAQEAFRYISAQHHHGYKYQLKNVASSKLLKKDDSTCEFHLELDLEETVCHVINPKPINECAVRTEAETKVESNCNVTITVADGKATMMKCSCSSEPASAAMLHSRCPDCPSLLSLYDPMGLTSIKEALKKFHKETNETSCFRLLEVGRISTQWIHLGQSYFAEFAIVETDCSPQVNSSEEDNCQVFSKGKARNGFCQSTMLGNGDVSVDCEIYDAENVTKGYHHHHHHHHHRPHHHHHHPRHRHRPHHHDHHRHPHPHSHPHGLDRMHSGDDANDKHLFLPTKIPPFFPKFEGHQLSKVRFPHCQCQAAIPKTIHPICLHSFHHTCPQHHPEGKNCHPHTFHPSPPPKLERPQFPLGNVEKP